MARKLQAPPQDQDEDQDPEETDPPEPETDEEPEPVKAESGKGSGKAGGDGDGEAPEPPASPDIDALVQAKVDQALSSLTSAGGDVKQAVAEVLDQKEHRAEHEALKPLATQEPPSRGPFWRFFFGNK